MSSFAGPENTMLLSCSQDHPCKKKSECSKERFEEKQLLGSPKIDQCK